MTLYVTREGQKVTIHGNNGLGVDLKNSRVQSFTVDEDWQHLRSFWGDLGDRIREAEAEANAVHEPQQGGF
jgi:hypothetical protein